MINECSPHSKPRSIQYPACFVNELRFQSEREEDTRFLSLPFSFPSYSLLSPALHRRRCLCRRSSSPRRFFSLFSQPPPPPTSAAGSSFSLFSFFFFFFSFVFSISNLVYDSSFLFLFIIYSLFDFFFA
jgi:hypothetical protein